MSYRAFIEQQQKEFDGFPVLFAFSDDQLAEGCKRLEITDPAKELYSIGAGGYIRKADSASFHELVSRLTAEREAALQEYDFLLDALIYELNNHEYCYSLDPAPALNVLGFATDDLKTSEPLRQAYHEALRQIEWEG